RRLRPHRRRRQPPSTRARACLEALAPAATPPPGAGRPGTRAASRRSGHGRAVTPTPPFRSRGRRPRGRRLQYRCCSIPPAQPDRRPPAWPPPELYPPPGPGREVLGPVPAPGLAGAPPVAPAGPLGPVPTPGPDAGPQALPPEPLGPVPPLGPDAAPPLE